MAGHSKWKNIKHKKAASDAKKAKIFTKLIKEISVAARSGGGDPQNNPHLRHLVEKSKKINMPQDNVIRAIKKGTGELPGQHYESHFYEGYGPHGIAVLIDVLTDNKNRAVAEVRHFFSRNGGSLAEAGAVSWMFEKKGILTLTQDNVSEDKLLEILIDYNVYDINYEENVWTIICDPKSIEPIKEKLREHGFSVDESELEWVAQASITLEKEAEEKATEFLQNLEELEDIQNIYSNLA